MLRVAPYLWVMVPYVVSGLVAWLPRPESKLGPLLVVTGFTLAALGLAPPLDAAGAPSAPRRAREVPCTGSR